VASPNGVFRPLCASSLRVRNEFPGGCRLRRGVSSSFRGLSEDEDEGSALSPEGRNKSGEEVRAIHLKERKPWMPSFESGRGSPFPFNGC
jgi:hypothetical protein